MRSGSGPPARAGASAAHEDLLGLTAAISLLRPKLHPAPLRAHLPGGRVVREEHVEGPQEILLRSDVGEWIGIAKRGPIKERHLQAHWPEANVLISRRFDPISGEPDYNAIVSVERLPRGA